MATATTRLSTILNHLNLNPTELMSCPVNAEPCKSNNTNEEIPSFKKPLKICVTGAAGQIAYALLFKIARGEMFGSQQPIFLTLLDLTVMKSALDGVIMELEDSGSTLLTGVIATDKEEIAFKDIDIALFLGAFPRKQGMERKDLLKANVKIFQKQGELLNQYASKNVKVLVVGNPANSNCYIAMKSASGIPSNNFTALTRLDHNRAKVQVAKHLSVPINNVRNVVIWGNHSNTQFPDISTGEIMDYPKPGYVTPVSTLIKDIQWITKEFIPTVQNRGAAVIAARKLSSAASAAQAIVDHMRDWWFGTPPGEYVSMAVPSDGSYGVPEGLIFSYPVICYPGGSYKIVQNVKISDFANNYLTKTIKELVEEKNDAIAFIS